MQTHFAIEIEGIFLAVNGRQQQHSDSMSLWLGLHHPTMCCYSFGPKKDLLKQVKARCPKGTPVPSVSWLSLQFWPKSRHNNAQLHLTRKVDVKYSDHQLLHVPMLSWRNFWHSLQNRSYWPCLPSLCACRSITISASSILMIWCSLAGIANELQRNVGDQKMRYQCSLEEIFDTRSRKDHTFLRCVHINLLQCLHPPFQCTQLSIFD